VYAAWMLDAGADSFRMPFAGLSGLALNLLWKQLHCSAGQHPRHALPACSSEHNLDSDAHVLCVLR
jgi:hypothetical protein